MILLAILKYKMLGGVFFIAKVVKNIIPDFLDIQLGHALKIQENAWLSLLFLNS